MVGSFWGVVDNRNRSFVAAVLFTHTTTTVVEADLGRFNATKYRFKNEILLCDLPVVTVASM